jgi:hypothetical protein
VLLMVTTQVRGSPTGACPSVARRTSKSSGYYVESVTCVTGIVGRYATGPSGLAYRTGALALVLAWSAKSTGPPRATHAPIARDIDVELSAESAETPAS